jgi:hypothetical protein
MGKAVNFRLFNNAHGQQFLTWHSPKPDRQNDVDFQQSVDFVVLQVSNADKFVAERLSCVLRLPNRRDCR